MSEGMFLSVVCSEDMPRIHADDIVRESQGRFLGMAFFDTRMKPCEFWPKGEVGEDFYQPVVSARPVLILSGADDPITPRTGTIGGPVVGVMRHLARAGSGSRASSTVRAPIG